MKISNYDPLDPKLIDYANEIAESWERELRLYPNGTGFTKQHIKGIQSRANKLAQIRQQYEEKMRLAMQEFDEYQDQVCGEN